MATPARFHTVSPISTGIGRVLAMCMLSIVLVAAFFADCSSNESQIDKAINPDESRWATEEAKSISDRIKLIEGGNIFLHSDARQVMIHVQKAFAKRDITKIAALVNVTGPWQDQLWYEVLCEEFARGFTIQRPIKFQNPDQAIRALKALAGKEYSREVRVLAALALMYDDGNLARTVLLDEYATFSVAPWVPPGTRYPVPCGPPLQSMGVALPNEIVSVERAIELLKCSDPTIDVSDSESRSKAANAANRFNQYIRGLLNEKDTDTLSELVGIPQQVAILSQLFMKTSTSRPSATSRESMWD